jgi:hypothetical protein
MSTQPPSAPHQGDEASPPDPAELSPEQSERQEKRRQRIADYLQEKWGDPQPCPMCRVSDWHVDPVPVLWQRVNSPIGTGVPSFLVLCSNCGYEVAVNVQTAGMWDELSGVAAEETAVRIRPHDTREVPSNDGEPNGTDS